MTGSLVRPSRLPLVVQQIGEAPFSFRPRTDDRESGLPAFMETLPLFGDPEPQARSPLAARLQALAGEGVYFGTSSWKYPGWLGSIYRPERYLTRGRFSQKKFESECLSEYAETFPAVCGDFSFYQF